MRRFLAYLGLGLVVFSVGFGCDGEIGSKLDRPNILWIIAEDASPHIGCYGHKYVKTPYLDALASEGIRFTNAFVTSPICSPSRSAMITGLYPTTLGSHNHKSQTIDQDGGGNKLYYDSYKLPAEIPLISDLFKQAGYYTCNGEGSSAKKPGKTDYNFLERNDYYDGADWKQRPLDKPFFAQIQLRGGKNRIKASERLIKAAELPPYYPDNAIQRKDWASYLASWEATDREVGKIIADLKREGVYENTVIFFFTDHGMNHLRGKQFLYDEGIQVPLIIRLPENRKAGSVEDHLVLHIDVGVSSLALAGIPLPENVHGKNLFKEDEPPRDYIISARDRSDETPEIIRCLRTRQFKYIRNFMSYLSHTQPNQHKDKKMIMKNMRELYAVGKLTELQSFIFKKTRPPEELYNIEIDPHETQNLAYDPQYQETVSDLREKLYHWMEETGDLGLIPEPILEDLGKERGNKYFVSQENSKTGQVMQLIRCIEAGENQDINALRRSLGSDDPSEQYWAAKWLGILKDQKSIESLKLMTSGKIPALRIASNLALWQISHDEKYIQGLVDEIDNPNLTVGLYAMNAIEQTEVLNDLIYNAADRAFRSEYDFTHRCGRRLLAKFKKVKQTQK
jgi:arylsulfatase A-like enzyme